jgi:hypothetical protein
MRALLLNPLVAGALMGVCACAGAPPQLAQAPAGIHSADRQAVAAVAFEAQQGYSGPSRRIVDCAASFPGYDYRSDLYEVRPGETQRCPL